jgi:RNA-directed DNA polymerase
MVVKMYLEPKCEPYFHRDSYGYRPGKSAIEAVGIARERCWRYDWVLDLDIQGFFDHLDHDLVLRAVRHHTDCPWILLYIKRWLKAPAQMEDGTVVDRDTGSPQGSVISPLLSNLYLHYAFDAWMQRTHPNMPFERYADDIIVHCRTQAEAEQLWSAIAGRLEECKLALHPEKTKIVYCKDGNRKENYPHEAFDFLGFTFRPRMSKSRYGNYFVGFNPAVSNRAVKTMHQAVRTWRLHLRSDLSLNDLACRINPTIRGWINYYGSYRPSELCQAFKQLNHVLKRWAMRKYKKLRRHGRRAVHWLGRIASREPRLFAHWDLLSLRPAAGR